MCSTLEWAGNDHTYGSRHYVSAARRSGSLASAKAFILVDMIADRDLQIRVAADDILIATQQPEGISAGNVLSGTIRRIEPVDGEALITVMAGDEFVIRLTSAAIQRLGLRSDTPVFLIIKTRSFRVL